MDNSAERKLEKLHSLCLVLGKNFEQLTEEKLGAPSENNEYSTKLDLLLQTMSDQKSFRITQARSLATRVLEYWNLLCVPVEERNGFTHLFCWIDSVPMDSINEPNQLSSTTIGAMIDELDRVEDICRVKLSEKIRVLDKCKKLAGLDDPNSATHQLIGEDDEDEDVVKNLRSVKSQIKKMKKEISSRGGIVTVIAIVSKAVDEVKWYRSYSDRAQALSNPNHDMHERVIEAQKSNQNIIGMLNDLEVKVKDWMEAKQNSFYYNGVDLIVTINTHMRELSEAAPGVEMNLQVHQAPQPVMNPQPQQIEAQAEGVDVPYLPNPVGMNVPRSARTPRVLVEPQPPAPAEPHQAAPAEPDLHRPLLASDSSGSSEDPDDPNDPDYAP